MNGVIPRRVTLALLAIGILAAAGCGEKVTDKTGRGRTVVISTGGDADILFPPTHVQLQALVVTDLIFDKLADIGHAQSTIGDAGATPKLADRWEWAADSMSVTFHLNPKARWHDGHPVRASDVRFAFNVYTDKALGASTGRDILDAVDSISVSDSLTCTAWFKARTLERFHVLTYNLKPLPEHLIGSIRPESLPTSAFARQPVGNGPFRLVAWERGQRIEVAAVDSFQRGRPAIDRVIWTIVTSNTAATQRVFSGEADFIERIDETEAKTAESSPEVSVMPTGGSSYHFLVFNQKDGATNNPHPILGDREMRRALTAAVDKQAIVANVLGSLGRVSLGPFVRRQWSADTTLTQIAFNRDAAAKTLDSLGWKVGADGIRERNGKKLTINLLTTESSQARKRSAVLLQEQWRQIGVQVNVEVLDNAGMGQRVMQSRQFDAFMHGLTPGPSPSGLRQSWTTAAIGMRGALNFARYSNPRVDAAVDAALKATHVDSAKSHYRLAYQTLVDDAPAIWLLEPIVVAAANRRLDVGTFRPDAWWSSLPAWRLVSDNGTR
jgi:peptide/nickel transport system substrate-binding protein